MAQLQKKFLANNAVDENKIRLSNNANLKARNAANSADVNILKVNASDKIEFASVPQATADASAGNDLVRYSQITGLLDGLKPKQAVRAATTVAGTLATSFENLDVIDGVTLATGDRILIKDQAAPAENGIYIVQASGAPVRASDYNAVSEIPGSYTVAQEGTDNAGVLFVTTSSPAVLDTDPIAFVARAVQSYTGGDMISLTGSAFAVDLASDAGLESSNPGNAAGQLRAKLDGSTLARSASGLKVSDAGITATQIAASVAGSGLAGGAGSALSVNVDDSTIEINTDALRVKDAGITLAKMALNSVDENKIVSTTINSAGALNGGSGTKLLVRTDASTVKINGSNNLEGLKGREQKITLNGTDITNQFVDLAFAAFGVDAANNSIQVAVVGGPIQEKAVDYTVSLTGGSGGVTRISFAGDLATGGAAELISGDKLVINFEYLS